MKKLILATLVLLVSLPAVAQVKFFEGTFEEALARSKSEIKPIVVLVTSPKGCPPCAALEKDIFPLKSVGDYMNSNVIFIKYETDNVEGAKLAEKYNARAVPTFIYIDSDGNEFMRQVGGSASSTQFINGVHTALKPENSTLEMEKSANENLESGIKYLNHLTNVYMTDKANKFFDNLFLRLTVEEKFSDVLIDYYKRTIESFESPAFQFMLSNGADAAKVMGKDDYMLFMKGKSDEILSRGVSYAIYKKDMTEVKELLAIISDNKILKTGFSAFLSKNMKLIEAGRVDDMMNIYKRSIKNVGSATRESIVNTYMMFLSAQTGKDLPDEALDIYELAVKYEKDNICRHKYDDQINGINNYLSEQEKR